MIRAIDDFETEEKQWNESDIPAPGIGRPGLADEDDEDIDDEEEEAEDEEEDEEEEEEDEE